MLQKEPPDAELEGAKAKTPRKSAAQQRKEREEEQEERDKLFGALTSIGLLAIAVAAVIGGRAAGGQYALTVGTSFFTVGSYGAVVSVVNYMKYSRRSERIFVIGHLSISALALGFAIIDLAVFHTGRFGLATGVFGLYLIFSLCIYSYFLSSDAWVIGWYRGGSYLASIAGLSGLFDPVLVQPLAIFSLILLAGLIVFSIAKARSTREQVSWGMLAGLAVIGAAVVAGAFVCADNLNSPFAPNLPIHGTVTLVSHDDLDDSWFPLGDGTCQGAGSYDDVMPGPADVIIWRNGQLVTAVDLGAGQINGPDCVFPFTASVQARARSYGVQLGQRAIVSFTLDQIVHPQLTMGN